VILNGRLTGQTGVGDTDMWALDELWALSSTCHTCTILPSKLVCSAACKCPASVTPSYPNNLNDFGTEILVLCTGVVLTLINVIDCHYLRQRRR